MYHISSTTSAEVSNTAAAAAAKGLYELEIQKAATTEDFQN